MEDEYQEISANLVDFVSKMTHSVATAQKELDFNAIEMLKELAHNEISVPVITNHVTPIKDAQGNVIEHQTHTETREVSTSLLNLGIRPSFYQFSKTVIEVALDVHMEEKRNETRSSKTKGQRLMVNTRNVRRERRYNRDIKAYSKLSIEMVPVPMPNRLPELILDRNTDER